jgi:lipopolysaccharide export system protein LptA
MRIFIFLMLVFTVCNAQKVEITADSFEADEKKHISTLVGNVTILKGADLIKADNLIVRFDEKNKPIEYIANGNISFNIVTQNQEFDGSAQKLLYNPKTLKYEISGNAIINEKTQHQKLMGEKIIIDRISGKSKIIGAKNRPVKFIFDVKE